MNCENFYPSINGVCFKNYKIVQSSSFTKHIKGDIYYQDKCIGYYDPLYHSENTLTTKPFIRIEDSDIENLFKKYRSIFCVNAVSNTLPNDYDCGFLGLMKDLEYLTFLYSFMHQIKDDDKFENIKLIGIINNEFIQVFQLKDNNINTDTDREIINFFKEKIEQYVTGCLDNNYPIKLFKKLEDFKIN